MLWVLMRVWCKEEKRYEVNEDKEFHPGMYFENMGPVRIIGGEYTIVHYLTLDEYNSKYDSLGEKIENMTAMCYESSIKSFICTKHQDILLNLYLEIKNRKEKIYLSLGAKDVIRKRRGLINAIGSGMNTLFGVCDDSCVQKTSEVIEQSKKNNLNVLHLMKSQTTVIKSAMKQMGISLNKSKEIYDEIKEAEKYFIKNQELLENKTDHILDMFYATELQNMYTLLVNEYAYETTKLSEIVTAARAGIIHSDIITPGELVATLREVSGRIKSRLEIPMGYSKGEIYQLQKITKTTIYYDDEGCLTFIATIPLITETAFNLYNTIPVPIMKGNVTALVKPDLPYIAITKDRKQYTQYSEPEILNCKDTDMFKICPAMEPIRETRENPPCEVGLFSKPGEFPSSCEPKTIIINRNVYHRLRYENKWLYAVAHNTLLRITCDDLAGVESTYIRSTGTITIYNSECIITTDDVTLTPIKELSTKLQYLDFAPKTDINILKDAITHEENQEIRIYHMKKILTNVTNLHDFSKSLDAVDELVNREIQKQEVDDKLEIHSNLMYFTIILATLSIVLVIVIYIMIKCDLYSKSRVEPYTIRRRTFEDEGDPETTALYEMLPANKQRKQAHVPPPPPPTSLNNETL